MNELIRVSKKIKSSETLGEIGAEYDRIYELHRLIKNAYMKGSSFAELHPLAQELADLTSVYAVKEKKE